MVKVTFKQTIMGIDYNSMSNFIAKHLYGKEVVCHKTKCLDFILVTEDDVIKIFCNESSDLIQSIEHVKPTDL